MAQSHLDKIYDVEGPKALKEFYDNWADSYDGDLEDQEYVTPSRVAAALADFVPEADRDQPVLDFGCGTGLSGEALSKAGFTQLHGADVSEGMLEKAKEKGVYAQLLRLPGGALDPEIIGRYRLVTAAGAISAGAAPAETLPQIIDALPAGGLLVVSYNGHTLEDEAYMAALTRVLTDGATLESAQDGDHLPGIGLKSRVMVLRKT